MNYPDNQRRAYAHKILKTLPRAELEDFAKDWNYERPWLANRPDLEQIVLGLMDKHPEMYPELVGRVADRLNVFLG